MATATRTRRTQTEGTSRQHLAELSEQRQIQAASAWFRHNETQICRWQTEVCSVPAPPFGEAERAAWLRDKFRELELQQVAIDEAGNVTGIFPGSARDSMVAVAAHMDTVFSAQTPIHIRREGERLWGPGISDNGAGLAALMALAAAMNAANVKPLAPILFVATVGEEGEGDLRGIRHIFSTAGWKDSIRYTLVVDGAGTETIVRQALGSRRFEITLRGKGGHSWSDFGDPNPIAALARAIANFYKTPASSVQDKKSAYNVGMISGGTSVNSIPESAAMRFDLRGQSSDEIDNLETALRHSIEAAIKSDGTRAGNKLRCEIRKIGDRPAAVLANGARILQIVKAVDAHLGIRSRMHCSSTDANIPLALGEEAVSIGAGGTGGGAHTLHEWFDPKGRELGLKRILLAVAALAGLQD